MSGIVHKVILKNDRHFGRKLPVEHLGKLFAELPQAIRASVSMAFRNQSSGKGRRPRWLDRAADVRFVDHQGSRESVLYFEAPPLGEAAPEVYEQQTLFPEADDRPSKEDTAFDLFGDVLADVGQRNSDSAHFDHSLLSRLTKFNRVFRNSPFTEVDFTSRRFPAEAPARFSPSLIESAELLLGTTPVPQRVRIVGRLDALVASTQRFSVLLDSGEKISGVFSDDQIDMLQTLWRKRVLVLGTAVYRASGRLLRIEAEAVKAGDNEPKIFSRMPPPPASKLEVAKVRKPQ
ncbi:MAG TPA: hypothetical protein PLV92_28205, partial [Pirellulaceae bacterium]|nr:hypothetical protein [Pirellulaceae bacterium]